MSDKKQKKGMNFSVADADKFIVKDADKYPNRLTCYLKIKLYDQKQSQPTQESNLMAKIHGTGCLVHKNYILTAAHNIYKIDKTIRQYKQKNKEISLGGYVKQALHEGKTEKILKIKKRFISKDYEKTMPKKMSASQKQKNKTKQKPLSDFALLQIEPEDGSELKEEQFMIPVVFSPETMSKITSVQVYGYPVEVNRDTSKMKNKQNQNYEDKSSLFMYDQFGAQGGFKNSQQITKIYYQLPTDVGVSGGAVTAQLNEKYYIIGIHKGKDSNNDNNDLSNCGTSTHAIILEMNQWGWELIKEPFVYTEKTLKIKEKKVEMDKLEVLFLMNNKLNYFDISVIAAFDLSRITKIFLSGNQIGNEGFQLITHHPLPNLTALFVAENYIDNLDNVPKQNWLNLSNLQTLSLSVNKLKTIPTGLYFLAKMQKLWLSFNEIKILPNELFQFCEKSEMNRTVYVYSNPIKKDQMQQYKQKIQKTKVQFVWERVTK